MGNYRRKPCKICQQQIDIRTWKCPNCNQRQNETLKLYFPIALTLIIFMAMGWFSYQFWVHQSEANKRENRTYLVISEFSDLFSSLKDAETGQRGFIITGNREYLKPYNDSLSLVESHLSTLHSLTSDNPNQQRRLTTLELQIRTRLLNLDEIIKLRSAKGFQSASDRMKMGFEKKSIESLRELVGQALDEEKELLKVRSALERKYAGQVFYAILFAGILSSLILVTVYIVLWREYARRLIVESEITVDRNMLQEQNQQITSANEALRIEITERREAEEALQRSEERYRTLFNTMNEGFCIIEMLFDTENQPIDYRFLNTNPAFETQTGVRNVQGKLMSELSSPERAENWSEIYGKVALTGEPVRFVNEAKTLNRWFDVSAYRVDGPDSRKVAILFNDITEAKRAETVLKNSNENLEKRVAERTGELATTIDKLQAEIVEREMAEERTRRLNRLYAVLSETNQAIVRTKDRDTLFKDFCRIAVGDGNFKLAWVGLVDDESGKIKTVAADGATGYLDDIKITVNEEPAGLGPTGISLREDTYCICNDFLNSPITRPWHERGQIHGIRASASIALKQEGRVIGALALYADTKDFFDQQQVDLLRQVGADISFALDNIVLEIRHQEAERSLREETLERLLAVETLREKEQLLIQQSRQAAMGEMIGNIAHQWRQPLNTLGLLSQQLLLYYDMGEFDRAFLFENVDKEMELIQHMSKTIDDFRNYFKPDKERVDFKVKEAVISTLSLLEGSLQNPQINVEVVEKDDPIIHGYPNEFAQVLLNLVVNAKDVFTERKIVDPTLMIIVSNEDSCVVVTIADNAGGINEEIIDKIFDPYFTTKGPQGGTGIGLFMSKTIIEKNMGGRLTVRNFANGAEFRIEI